MKYEHFTKVNVIAAVALAVMIIAVVALGVLGFSSTVVAIPVLGIALTIAGWMGSMAAIGFGLEKRA